ncbi:TetR family transcriptional regulator [Streptomyces sp. NRRL B-1677]|uniref:TetR/AcrR family transcriptional regulator n=1 Tax=Streptomyces klenkii TaxID=1420899 RepID=A0A3B0BVN3_9ACTN|nr:MULTISPECIES: TetR family transcriptional regulator [Streptomyces]MBF6049009.1 TetR family transcriptional regulator [Streptomyces sp. NRRL B-1677]RKN76294.1 TetR/AcrR family transcriptional regulator [Streptomyces klenkii]
MPAARELLLDAAFAALRSRPWNGVRMVDVAAAAGVSRQTLYNEFGSKDGLARALVRREAEAFLAGVERALAAAPAAPAAAGADAGARCAAAACWILRTARANPLVRAALTGCRGDRLPVAAAPVLPAPRGPFAPAAPRSAPGAAALTDAVRERTVRAVSGTAGERVPEAVQWACEAAVRLTLSFVVAPGASDEEAAAQVARLVRTLVGEHDAAGSRTDQ